MGIRLAEHSFDESWMPSEEVLQRELGHGLRWLHFGPELERAFRADYENAVQPGRRLLLFLSVLLIGATPLYDGWLLHAPDEFNRIAHRLQFILEIPPLLLALGLSYAPKLRRWAAPTTVIALTAVAAGLIAQRIIGARLGFAFPHNFASIVVAGGFLLAGLRMWFLLPSALLILVANGVAEFYAYGYGGERIYEVMSIGFMFSLSLAGACYVEYLARSNWLRRKLLARQAASDPLTGLSNRREFLRLFERLLRQAAREQRAIAVMMVDVDHFKAYNDHYGHPAGDDCLRKIGAALRNAARRPLDVQARIGGEEFVVVWFDPEQAAAPRLAEAACAAISALGIPHAHSSCASVVTVSAGLLWLRPARDMSVVELLEQADRLLYDAKRGGRNRLIPESREAPAPARRAALI